MKKTIIIIFLFSLTSCYNQETLVDKTKLIGGDYRLYQSTVAWELAKAVQVGDTIRIKEEILQKKVPIDYRELIYGQSLLFLAITNSQYKSVKKLLDLGANPNLHDKFNGATPVIEAAHNDDPKYLKLILNYKGDPNSREFDPKDATNPERDTALTATLSSSPKNNSLEKVKLLIDAGADIEYYNEHITQRPLAQSIIHERMDVTLYLLQKGADYNQTAYYEEKVSILRLLRGVLLDLNSEQYKKKLEVIAFLKNKGLDYDKQPIEEADLKRMKFLYPNNWQEYMKRY